MALTYQSAGTYTYQSTPGNGSLAVPYPSTVNSGDLLILVVNMKPSTGDSDGSVTTPSGWTLQGSSNWEGGYGSTIAADQGDTKWRIYTKDTVTGSESGYLNLTVSGEDICGGGIIRVSHDASVTYATAFGGTSAGVTPMTVTMSSNPGITSGDLLIAGLSEPTDVATGGARYSNWSVTATGATIATPTEIYDKDTAGGTDLVGGACYAAVTAGTASAAPVVSASVANTVTNSRGPGFVLRIREASGVTVTPGVVAGTATVPAPTVPNQAPAVTPATVTGFASVPIATFPGEVSLVQAKQVTTADGSLSATVVLDSPVTAGNIVIVAVAQDKASNYMAVSTPSGFETLVNESSTSVSLFVAWKKATGGATTFTVDPTTANPTSSGATMWVAEYSRDGYSGTDWEILTTVINPTDETTTMSPTVGPPVAGLSAPGLGLAFGAIATISMLSDATTHGWSGGFIERETWYNHLQDGAGGLVVGEKQVILGGHPSTTYTYNDTADQWTMALIVIAPITSNTPNLSAYLGVDTSLTAAAASSSQTDLAVGLQNTATADVVVSIDAALETGVDTSNVFLVTGTADDPWPWVVVQTATMSTVSTDAAAQGEVVQARADVWQPTVTPGTPTAPPTLVTAPPVSTPYLDALYGGARAVSRIQVLNSGAVITEIDFLSGTVTAEASRATRRTCDLVFPAEQLVPISADDPLYPVSNELKVWRGVQWADGTESLVPLGVFVFYETEVDEGPDGVTIRVSGMDRAERLRQALFTEAFPLPKGTPLTDAISEILNDRDDSLPDLAVVSSSPYTTPAVVYPPGTDPWSACQSLATAGGLQLFFDREGVPTLSSIPNPQASQPVITYDVDDVTTTQTVLSINRVLSSVNTYNGVIASGSGSDLVRPMRAERWDENPASPFYYLGPFGKKPLFYSSPLLTCLEQVEDAADAQLARVLGMSEQVTWTALVNPAHDVYDVVGLRRGAVGIDANFAIDSLTVPLTADQPMTAVGRNTVAMT